MVFASALIIAEAMKYLKEPARVEGRVKTLAKLFVSVDPDLQTAENFSDLFNKLLVPHGIRVDWLPERTAWLASRLLPAE
jgi:hypothetical protein